MIEASGKNCASSRRRTRSTRASPRPPRRRASLAPRRAPPLTLLAPRPQNLEVLVLRGSSEQLIVSDALQSGHALVLASTYGISESTDLTKVLRKTPSTPSACGSRQAW